MSRKWEIGLGVASLLVSLGFNIYSLRRRTLDLTDEQLRALQALAKPEQVPRRPSSRAHFERSSFGNRR